MESPNLQFGRCTLSFRRRFLPQSPGCLLPCRWRQHLRPKCRCVCPRVEDVTSQKTIMFIVPTVRISNLTRPHFFPDTYLVR